jgi:hypothetical protein
LITSLLNSSHALKKPSHSTLSLSLSLSHTHTHTHRALKGRRTDQPWQRRKHHHHPYATSWGFSQSSRSFYVSCFVCWLFSCCTTLSPSSKHQSFLLQPLVDYVMIITLKALQRLPFSSLFAETFLLIFSGVPSSRSLTYNSYKYWHGSLEKKLLFQGNAVMGCDYFNCYKHIHMRCEFQKNHVNLYTQRFWYVCCDLGFVSFTEWRWSQVLYLYSFGARFCVWWDDSKFSILLWPTVKK